MSKREREAELSRLRDWCVTVVQFLREAEPEFDPERSLEMSYEHGVRTRNLRGFRAGARDLLEMAMDLPASERRALDARLRAKVGSGLHEQAASVAADVQRVLARGRIANDREFQALRSRLESLDPDRDRTERQRIDEILWEFGQRRSGAMRERPGGKSR
jgi:hypothetical protein